MHIQSERLHMFSCVGQGWLLGGWFGEVFCINPGLAVGDEAFIERCNLKE